MFTPFANDLRNKFYIYYNKQYYDKEGYQELYPKFKKEYNARK